MPCSSSTIIISELFFMIWNFFLRVLKNCVPIATCHIVLGKNYLVYCYFRIFIIIVVARYSVVVVSFFKPFVLWRRCCTPAATSIMSVMFYVFSVSSSVLIRDGLDTPYFLWKHGYFIISYRNSILVGATVIFIIIEQEGDSTIYLAVFLVNGVNNILYAHDNDAAAWGPKMDQPASSLGLLCSSTTFFARAEQIRPYYTLLIEYHPHIYDEYGS